MKWPYIVHFGNFVDELNGAAVGPRVAVVEQLGHRLVLLQPPRDHGREEAAAVRVVLTGRKIRPLLLGLQEARVRDKLQLVEAKQPASNTRCPPHPQNQIIHPQQQKLMQNQESASDIEQWSSDVQW